jgi:hypothetical protein
MLIEAVPCLTAQLNLSTARAQSERYLQPETILGAQSLFSGAGRSVSTKVRDALTTMFLASSSNGARPFSTARNGVIFSHRHAVVFDKEYWAFAFKCYREQHRQK